MLGVGWLRVGWLCGGCLLSLPLAAACVSPLTYEVTQASTIPLPTLAPPPSSRGVADLYAGTSTLTFSEEASGPSSSQAGLYLPRTQLEGALSFQHALFGGRLLGGIGLGDGPRMSPTLLDRPTGAPGYFGGALQLGYFDETERFSFHVAFEGLLGFVASVQNVTPIDELGRRGATYTNRFTDLVPIAGAEVSLGYWATDWLRVMGGVGVRSSPTNRAAFVVDRSLEPPRSSVVFGDLLGLLWLGAELRLPFTEEVGGALVPYVSWPFTGGPVVYGPTIGIGIRLTFGVLHGSSIVATRPRRHRTTREAPGDASDAARRGPPRRAHGGGHGRAVRARLAAFP